MTNKQRILQLKAAFEWFNKASTCDIVKLSFNTAVDTVAVDSKIAYAKWVKIHEDISRIWETGTDEERELINKMFEEADKK